MIVCGFDPGISTGFAIAKMDDETPLTYILTETIKGGIDGFINWWDLQKNEYDLIVCETFVIDGTIAPTDSAQIEGAIKALWKGPVRWQGRGDKAALKATEPARREWFKERGMTFPNSHELDAATHLMVAAKRLRHFPTLREYWPDAN